MGKKGRKTRWRKLPIPIGNGGQRQAGEEDDEETPSRQPAPAPSRTTFNEDEYTKITTPRQDMLFKKGYLGRKKTTPTPSQDVTDAQSAESVESEQYCCEEQIPQYMYPTPTGYIDHTGIYYVPNYEVYDPYTGGVTVVVGPAPGFPGAHPVLAALPCAPVPLQPVEWFAPIPPPQQPPPPPPQPAYTTHRKKSSNSIDSQNWSGQSSESTCPPGSPQDSTEQCEMQPYVYPGYMFGPQVYNVNGVNVQGVVPQSTQPPSDQSKRRKKRRRRRRGGVTDEGSESSCEEVCSIEAPGSSASSSKTNSDSGIATDPCGASNGQGSLSSLSNDEAEKDTKSIPSEGDASETKPEVSDTKDEQRTSLINEPCSDKKDSEVVLDEESVITECPCSEPVAQDQEVDAPIPRLNLVSQESLQQKSEKNVESEEPQIENEKEHGKCEEEILACEEITEAFSDDEFVDHQENASSSDESTLPCTADDHSLDETQNENITENRLEINNSEFNLQEKRDKEDIVPFDEEEEIDKVITGFNDVVMYDLDHLELELDPPPVAPPRRKKCAKAADKLASKLSEEIVADAVSSAAMERWPITSAVTKWLEDSEDEIEEAEEALTGQKNGEGNPFPAPYHSGSGTRVASNEWYNSRVREMCDPIASVNKYYRLALPMKTGPSPFPCGVCCIIQ